MFSVIDKEDCTGSSPADEVDVTGITRFVTLMLMFPPACKQRFASKH